MPQRGRRIHLQEDVAAVRTDALALIELRLVRRSLRSPAGNGSAMVEAVAQLRTGLELLSQLREGLQRQRHELDLQVTIARALMATRGFPAPEVGEACARARQLCDELGHPQIVPMLFGEWAHRCLRGELDCARESAAEMLRLGENQNDLTLKVIGGQTLGLTNFSLRNFASCRDNLERAAALYDPAALDEYYRAINPSHPYLIVQLWLSRALGWLGYLDQARTNGWRARGSAPAWVMRLR
jgi:hypothetical protein